MAFNAESMRHITLTQTSTVGISGDVDRKLLGAPEIEVTQISLIAP